MYADPWTRGIRIGKEIKVYLQQYDNIIEKSYGMNDKIKSNILKIQ